MTADRFRRLLTGAYLVLFFGYLFLPLGIMAAAVSRWDDAREVLGNLAPGFAQSLERVDADPVVAPVFARHWPQWKVS